MAVKTVRRALALALAALIVPMANAAETLQSGVLISRDSQRVVFMGPGGSVESVAIASGKSAWISAEGAMPVAIGSDRVLVLREGTTRGRLGYAMLDLDSGRLLSRATVDLPPPARGLVQDRLGEQFTLTPSIEGLRWSHQRMEVEGAQLLVEDSASGSKHAPASQHEGALAIDWAQGKLAATAASQEKSSASAAVELGQPTADAPRTFRSAGGGYRLQSERQADGRYRWRISDSAGNRLGEIDSVYSYRPFDVVDGRLLFVTALRATVANGRAQIAMPTLTSVDLASGTVVWIREVRDTKYRGPHPS